MVEVLEIEKIVLNKTIEKYKTAFKNVDNLTHLKLYLMNPKTCYGCIEYKNDCQSCPLKCSESEAYKELSTFHYKFIKFANTPVYNKKQLKSLILRRLGEIVHKSFQYENIEK